MKTKYLVAVTLFIAVFLSGCKYLNKLGEAIYDPVVTTNTFMTNVVTRVPEVVLLENGAPYTNWVDRSVEMPVTLVSTNGWVLNPGIEGGIKLFGDVAPFPWAGTASWLATAVLGVGASLMGRKYKKAAVEGVKVALDARTMLKRHSPEDAETVKTAAVNRQNASGIKSTIDSILTSLKT